MATDDLASAWKALADPTRRQILDALRAGPQTTGALCTRFPRVTRFAVMKHLAVLEGAQLVLPRRRGRERWNHLNAIPLQHIHERWLTPYQTQWAESLLRLKRGVDSTTAKETIVPTTDVAPQSMRSFQIEQELTLHASRSVVFAALINDIGTWWGEHSYKPDRVKGIVVEPKVGGRFFEDWGNGEGWLFATVIGFDLDTGIDMVGPMGMDGPVVGIISYELADAPGGGTTLKLSHHAMGLFPEEMEANYSAGWTDLLDTRLRAFVERGEKMGFQAKHK